MTETNLVVHEPRAASASVTGRTQAHGAALICGGLLAVMALQILAVISRKSITNDEVISIPAGYYHLVAGNFQISMDHPPSPRCGLLYRYCSFDVARMLFLFIL